MRRFDHTSFVLVSTAFMIIGFSTGAIAENSVEGNLTVDGTAAPMQHIYVDQYRDEFTVVLTDNPVAQEMIPYEVSTLSEQGKVRALEFTVSRETQNLLPRMRRAIYFHPVWTRQIDIGNGVLTISKFDENQLVGRMKTPSENESNGHHFAYDISFSVSLKREPPQLTITGQNDPPSQAYAAYCKALMNGDMDEFKKYVPSENLASLPKDENELILGLEFAQDMMMTDIEILSSTISDTKAVLTMQGTRGLTTASGNVTMVLENGTWKVSEESWETGTSQK